MENKQKTERITLSIAVPTNQALEAIQHHLRRAGHRKFKSEIIYEAVVHFAQGLGLEVGGVDAQSEGDQDVEAVPVRKLA